MNHQKSKQEKASSKNDDSAIDVKTIECSMGTRTTRTKYLAKKS